MNLVESVKTILGRDLSSDEVRNLSAFQRLHEIDDSDPLIIVLAMMGANKILMEEVPKLLQQKSTEIIELHRSLLMEQSTAIAKNLVAAVAPILVSNKTPFNAKTIGVIAVAAAFFGAFCWMAFLLFVRH
jgi:hypothetical protein